MFRSFALCSLSCYFLLPAIVPAEEVIDPRRPAAITTQEVPVVPEEIFERLNQYSNIRGASFQGWAPDGNG
ncbi:MAG: S9 family peptidase, partial [Pirellulaceae bacterium]